MSRAGILALVAIAAGASGCGTVQSIAAAASSAVGNYTEDRNIEPVPTPHRVASDVAFVDVSAGGLMSCGLTNDGAAWCWGDNDQGQLGNGDTVASREPVAVAGGHRFASLAVGGRHACGVSDGSVWCWGHNGDGQLGNGTKDDSLVPVRVVSDGAFTQVSVGSDFSCALDDRGAAWCWGDALYEKLGVRRMTDATTPERVGGTTRFDRIEVGYANGCGLSDARLYCWGWNEHGQVGMGYFPRWEDSTQAARYEQISSFTTPTAVWGDAEWQDVTISHYVACGLTTAGETRCWGDALYPVIGYMDTGEDTLGIYPYPQDAAAGYRFSDISGGADFACGIGVDGGAYCWGENGNGQLGTGETNFFNVYEPRHVALADRVVALDAGEGHACAITDLGETWCWGNNGVGQVGAPPPPAEAPAQSAGG